MLRNVSVLASVVFSGAAAAAEGVRQVNGVESVYIDQGTNGPGPPQR